MNYAIIENAGNQYKVSEGMVIDIRGNFELNKEIFFDKVLLSMINSTVNIGSPYIKGVTVKGMVVENLKSKKIRGIKFRAKSRYRRAYGSRFNLSKIKVEKIDLQGSGTPRQDKSRVAGKRGKA